MRKKKNGGGTPFLTGSSTGTPNDNEATPNGYQTPGDGPTEMLNIRLTEDSTNVGYWLFRETNFFDQTVNNTREFLKWFTCSLILTFMLLFLTGELYKEFVYNGNDVVKMIRMISDDDKPWEMLQKMEGTASFADIDSASAMKFLFYDKTGQKSFAKMFVIKFFLAIMVIQLQFPEAKLKCVLLTDSIEYFLKSKDPRCLFFSFLFVLQVTFIILAGIFSSFYIFNATSLL